jgi:solute carrier family 35 protein F1/2
MEPSRNAVLAPEPDLGIEKADVEQTPEPSLRNEPAATTVRPAIEYESVGAFATSVGRRLASIWTRRFALALLAGQVVSLCITCTNVTTTELVSRNWSLPTTQTFFLCVC